MIENKITVSGTKNKNIIDIHPTISGYIYTWLYIYMQTPQSQF